MKTQHLVPPRTNGNGSRKVFQTHAVKGRPRERERAREAAHQPSAPKSALVKGLGWFSLGLGLLQFAAPGRMARLVGLADDSEHRALMKTLGLRELASGVGILTQDRPSDMLVLRVAGDMMDLVLLGSALRSETSGRGRVAAATVAVAGVTLLDLIGATEASEQGSVGRSERTHVLARGRERPALPSGRRALSLTRAISVNRSPEEVYLFWRDLRNLPRFMSHLESVETLGTGRSRWVARAPAGMKVQWEADILEDEPGSVISWRSLPGSDVENEGSVRFSPRSAGRGTDIVVKLDYRPPAGALGAAFAKLFGESPEQQIANDLRALKQVLEVGEVLRSDASVHRGAHPARPSGKPRPA